MLRFKFRNHYIKERTDVSGILYNKQRHIRIFMIKNHYEKLIHLSHVMDSKKFWDRVKPVFDNKMKVKNITLVENRKLIISEKQLAQTFKEYFVNIVPNIRIRATNLSTYENHETNNIVLINLKYKRSSEYQSSQKLNYTM